MILARSKYQKFLGGELLADTITNTMSMTMTLTIEPNNDKQMEDKRDRYMSQLNLEMIQSENKHQKEEL